MPCYNVSIASLNCRARSTSVPSGQASVNVVSEWSSVAQPGKRGSARVTKVPKLRPAKLHAQSRQELGERLALEDHPGNAHSALPSVEQLVVTCAGGIMLSCAVLRVNFSAIAPVIVDELGLSLVQLA